MKTVFVRDCWYVAAWDYEVPAQGLITRLIINEPIVIYRNQTGGLNALEDRCPHRGLPLSMGQREGDSLRCGYHGFKFNEAGTCIEIPGKEQVPAVVRVKRYAVAQRDSWIWVWMGDHEAADESLIPKSWSLDDPKWDTAAGHIDYKAYYELVNDNLVDASHLAYVHANSFGGGEWDAGPDRVVELERGVRLERWVFPPADSKVPGQDAGDMWNTYDHVAPGILTLTNYVYPPGSAARLGLEPPLEDAFAASITWQAVTPMTDATTRYYFAVGQRYGGPLDGQSAMNLAKLGFEEDRLCIEAQQRNLDLTGDRMVLAGHDEAAIRLRRILARLARGNEANSPPRSAGQAATKEAMDA